MSDILPTSTKNYSPIRNTPVFDVSSCSSISFSDDIFAELPPENVEQNVKVCVSCERETSGAHRCPGCHSFIHVICGRTEGEEGYGSEVWCPACDLLAKNANSTSLRIGIKRSQNKCHERMLSYSSKRIKPAKIGDNIVIPISKPDKLSTIGPRNILGCITDQIDDVYSVGTLEGIISVGYTRNQFELATTGSISPSMIPQKQVTQTEIMQNKSLGKGPNACKCKGCSTNRCPCRKASRHCTTKCHSGKVCMNK